MGHQAFSLQRSLKKLLGSQKVRFVLVGVINTIVDFIVLLSLVGLFSVQIIAANVVSTSCALIVSYLLNKKAVFKDTDPGNHRQVILFVAVTLTGIWLIQAIIIVMVNQGLDSLFGSVGTSSIDVIIAKSIATIGSLTWNYLWYSRVVFRRKTI